MSVEAPAANSPETVTTDDMASVAASFSPEVRNAVATGKMSFGDAAKTLETKETAKPETEPAPVEGDDPQPEPEPEPEPEPIEDGDDPEPNPEPEPEPEEPEGKDDGLPGRYRFQTDEDKAVAFLSRSKGISLIAAGKLYSQDNVTQEEREQAEAQARAAETPEVDPVVAEFDAQISSKGDELTALIEKRTKARDEADMEAADALSDQIVDLRSDIRDIERDKKTAIRERKNSTQQSFNAVADRSRDQAIETYPELGDEDSSFRLAYDGLASRVARDPKRKGFFNDPNWPLKLAKELATKQGVKPASEREKAVATPKPETPAKPKPKPASTARKTEQVTQASKAKMLESPDVPGASKPAQSPEQMLKELKDMTPEERRQVIRHMRQ